MNRNDLLQKECFIGEGSERECYLLPDTPEKCIKISKPGHGKKQHRRDLKLYRKIKKVPELWEHIARFQGILKTDKQEGLVFETIRDYDSKVSKSLLHYLYNDQNAIDKHMLEALVNLESFILRNRIILKDPSPSNILYQRLDPKKGKFILIDGISYIDIPFEPFQSWARYKTKRQWNKVIMRMLKETKNNPDLQDRIKTYFIKKERTERT